MLHLGHIEVLIDVVKGPAVTVCAPSAVGTGISAGKIHIVNSINENNKERQRERGRERFQNESLSRDFSH